MFADASLASAKSLCGRGVMVFFSPVCKNRPVTAVLLVRKAECSPTCLWSGLLPACMQRDGATGATLSSRPGQHGSLGALHYGHTRRTPPLALHASKGRRARTPSPLLSAFEPGDTSKGVRPSWEVELQPPEPGRRARRAPTALLCASTQVPCLFWSGWAAPCCSPTRTRWGARVLWNRSAPFPPAPASAHCSSARPARPIPGPRRPPGPNALCPAAPLRCGRLGSRQQCLQCARARGV